MVSVLAIFAGALTRDTAASEGAPASEAYALIEEAWAVHRSDPEAAAALAQESLVIADRSADRRLRVEGLNALAHARFIMQDFVGAVETGWAAHAASERLNDPLNTARALNVVGRVFRVRERYERSLQLQEEGLAFARRADDPALQEQMLGEVGLLYHRLGESQRGLELFARTYDRFASGARAEPPSPAFQAKRLRVMMEVAPERVSEAMVRDLLARARGENDTTSLLQALKLLAMKQAHSGNYEKADLHLRTAEAIAEGEDRMYSRIALLRQRAALAEEAGKTGRALALEREAGDLARAFYNLETDERELARLLNSFDSNILEVELALREAEAARLRSFILAAILGAVLAVGAAAFAWQRYRSHARANERLQVEADHDGLTSLMNRRKMEVLLDSYEQATRAGALDPAVVIALIDLDNFKMVNDRYGHDGGDQVLREVAKVLLKASRPQDPVCRWGGEEFVLVFEAMSLAEGLRWANHLRSAVARADLTLECGRTVAVTFSAGLAVLHKGLSAKDTLRMADQALYAAKAAGRNRVLAAKEVRYHHGEAGFDHDRSPALAMDQGQANVGTVSIEGMGALHLYTEREEEARRSVSAAG